MTDRDLWLYITYGLLAVTWLPAYILIARRGVLEHTYGMPIVAMLGNWPWEWIYGLNLDSACPLVWDHCPAGWLQAANFACMLLDAFIVYTVFRYGREKFSNPFIRRYYYPILIFGLISSFLIQYYFITEVGFPNSQHQPVHGLQAPYFTGDEGGSYSAYILTFAMGILFILMLTERNSLEGQSFIIATLMLLGNVAAYVFLLILDLQSPLLSALFYLTLFVNLLYCWMTYQKSLELGINPWRRW